MQQPHATKVQSVVVQLWMLKNTETHFVANTNLHLQDSSSCWSAIKNISTHISPSLLLLNILLPPFLQFSQNALFLPTLGPLHISARTVPPLLPYLHLCLLILMNLSKVSPYGTSSASIRTPHFSIIIILYTFPSEHCP